MNIREALTELCDAFNAHDLDRIMGLFSDDCALQMPRDKHSWGARFEGKQNVRATLAARFEGPGPMAT
jgi:ketosteroid isomerase-like protein